MVIECDEAHVSDRVWRSIRRVRALLVENIPKSGRTRQYDNRAGSYFDLDRQRNDIRVGEALGIESLRTE